MNQNARVLREDWVSQELELREGHLQDLSGELKPIAHGLAAESIRVTGLSGSGKTTIAKYIVRQLEEESLGIRWGYTNCISSPSESALIYSLARDAGGRTTSVPKGRRPRSSSIASARWTTTSSRSSTKSWRSGRTPGTQETAVGVERRRGQEAGRVNLFSCPMTF